MHVKIIKTYAWIKATPSSRPKSTTKISIGIIKPIEVTLFNNNIFQEKPTITFNRLCPAIRLINNRTPKLIDLAM